MGVVDRVPWVRYHGDDIEAVVAMMVNREHPDSVRIAPSQGDGGVDILDRGAGSDGGDVVYQVKGFAERKELTAPDKAKIVGSMKRVLDPATGDPRWSNLNVTKWRLVMPLDSTPEDFTWLEQQAEPYNVKVVWDGLTVIDQLAAKYGDVIDYYLHSGKSAIQSAYKEAMALISLGNAGATDKSPSLSVSEVTARIQDAFRMLDRDPHYVYELRIGQGEPPSVPNRPRLVLSTYQIDPTNATWHAIDVIARCVASSEERPITINGHLDVANNPQFAAAVKEFFEFGTPFASPDGAFSGVIDAPGGLGGELKNALVQTSPVKDADLGENVALTLQVLTPEGEVAAQVEVDRTDRSHGSSGLRSVLTETNGGLEVISMFDLKNRQTHLSLTLGATEGKPVGQTLPAVEFLEAFHHPNSYRIFVRHTPAHLGSTEPIPSADGRELTDMHSLADSLRALNTIQQHVSTRLVVPPASEFATRGESWALVSSILTGVSVTLTAKEGYAFHVVLPAGTSPPTTTFEVRLPLATKIGDQILELGTVRGELKDPMLLNETPLDDGRVIFTYETPDRKMRYLPDVDEENAQEVGF